MGFGTDLEDSIMATKKIATMKTPKKSSSKRLPSPECPILSPDDIVVFAFRMKRVERDWLHTAAGPGKASKFVRELVAREARKSAER